VLVRATGIATVVEVVALALDHAARGVAVVVLPPHSMCVYRRAFLWQPTARCLAVRQVLSNRRWTAAADLAGFDAPVSKRPARSAAFEPLQRFLAMMRTVAALSVAERLADLFASTRCIGRTLGLE